MPTINYAEKWGKGLVKGFNMEAYTGSMFSSGGDFVGTYTYHDQEIGTVPLGRYDVTKNTLTESRYGTPTDVGNIQYDYTVRSDISFTAVMDEIYNQGMLNEYKVGAFMQKQNEAEIAPELDTYRMSKWVEHAGFHFELPTGGLTEENAIKLLMQAHNLMRNAHVPKKGVQMSVRFDDWTTIRLARELIQTNDLAKNILPKGALTMLDDMAIVPMPDYVFPDNTRFTLSHKDAIIAPMKVKDLNIFEKSETHSGSKVNFLMIHDAFVRGHKACGFLAGVNNGTVAKKPAVAASSDKWAITSATSGATIKYTTDGSDPRFSKNAQTYSAAISADSKTKIKAAAMKDGLYWSDVVTFVVP